MTNIAVITTFPNSSWEVYGRKMIDSYVKYWPAEIPLMIQLDDNTLYEQVDAMLRPQDGITVGPTPDHEAFIKRNAGKDHPTDYRKQAVRFCHKVFAIKRTLDAINDFKAATIEGKEPPPRYLVWMDADVITTRPVTMDEIKACLPNDGDAVAYLGRKDWDHSECGWLAFDLESRGDKLIEATTEEYISDQVFEWEQWHDSFVWDRMILKESLTNATNLTANKPGTEIWEQSPMTSWSKHYKGPVAKQQLVPQRPMNPNSNIQIHTKNAIPDADLHSHIKTNQELISNWVRMCEPTDEEIVIVSAGPQLIAEDIRAHEGKKIVAVKHALEPLRKAGVKPWACILLDPRPHVVNFVQDADKDIIWFVASQVNPEVTKALLDKGCTVWGYHASVGANEGFLTKEQSYSIIAGGSATATRGLYLLKHLGFKNMILYGYDLCLPDKPDLGALDELKQPKYMEISLGMNDPLYSMKKCFWTEPQLIAQFEEMNEMLKSKDFKLTVVGDGIVPFIYKSQYISDMRNKELRDKIHNYPKVPIDKLLGVNRLSRE